MISTSIKKSAQRNRCLLGESLRPEQFWRDRWWLFELHLFSRLIVNTAVPLIVEIPIIKEADCLGGACDGSLKSASSIAQLVKLESPRLERSGLSKRLMSFINIPFLSVSVAHQSENVSKSRMEQFCLRYYMQGIGSSLGCILKAPAPFVTTGECKGYRNGHADADDTANRLDPCRQVARESGFLSGTGPITHQCPCTHDPSQERHCCHNGPVSVGSSLLHASPPFIDRILPLGVAA